jgi:Family of unknown function (DUF6325)
LTGPVSFMAVGFGPEATFEGAVVAELRRIEDSGMLRVLDLLFVRRDESGELETRPGIPGRPTLERAIAATGGEILQQGLLTTEQTQALAR